MGEGGKKTKTLARRVRKALGTSTHTQVSWKTHHRLRGHKPQNCKRTQVEGRDIQLLGLAGRKFPQHFWNEQPRPGTREQHRESFSFPLINFCAEATILPYAGIQAAALGLPGLCKHQAINTRATWPRGPFRASYKGLLGSIPVSFLST